MKNIKNNLFIAKPVEYQSIQLKEQFSNYVIDFYNSHTGSFVIAKLQHDQLFAPWTCFECKKQIQVDISSFIRNDRVFHSKSLFCDHHKENSSSVKNNHIFIRYENAFYASIKHKIINSTLQTLHMND